MKKTNFKGKTVAITLAVIMLILALFLLSAVIGGYVAAEQNAKATLTVNDFEAESIARAAATFGLREYSLKKLEKKVRWESSGFRPDNAYYMYEVELVDKRNGEDVDVYIDGRTGLIVGIDK